MKNVKGSKNEGQSMKFSVCNRHFGTKGSKNVSEMLTMQTWVCNAYANKTLSLLPLDD